MAASANNFPREYQVQKQPMPLGPEGAIISLQRVAKKIAEGRNHPMVRAWTMKQLAKAGNPRGPRARFEIILKAVREKNGPGTNAWVPDPYGSEYIVAAHHTLGDGDKEPLFSLGDCDDLTVASQSAMLASMMLVAAVESVGVQAAIVGHSYRPDRTIEHVLGAVYIPGKDGERGRWYYADPSLSEKDAPFGECKGNFTREIAIAVPSGETLCDSDVCLVGNGPAAGGGPPLRSGDFITVSGVGDDVDAGATTPAASSWVCDLGAPCCGSDEVGETIRVAPPPCSDDDPRELAMREAYNRVVNFQNDRREAEVREYNDSMRRLDESILEQRKREFERRRADCAEADQRLERAAFDIKMREKANIAQFNMWAKSPCSTDPLTWRILNVPPSRDVVAKEMFEPWHDGLEPSSGRNWLATRPSDD